MKKALIVENPSPVIDAHLRNAGLEVRRLETVPNEEGLIVINDFGACCLQEILSGDHPSGD